VIVFVIGAVGSSLMLLWLTRMMMSIYIHRQFDMREQGAMVVTNMLASVIIHLLLPAHNK
jgi:hypothetical protein